MVIPFHLGAAARRWVPAVATALIVAGAVPSAAAAFSGSSPSAVSQDTVPAVPGSGFHFIKPVVRPSGGTPSVLTVSTAGTLAAGSVVPEVTPVCNGKGATIVGAPGATVRGTQGPDVIVALFGDVRVDGRGGDDTICTGPGADIVNGGAGDDWIDAGDGANTASGGTGDDVIRAGSGDDILLGDSGSDRVDGGDGNNIVSTGWGDDVIVTGSGDDRIDGGRDFDTCQPGGGQNGVNHCEA